MRTLRNSLILAAAALLLAGCYSTHTLTKLQKTELTGSPFQIALAKLYRSFSETEAAGADWKDSAYFAEKGLKVATGNEVLPEDPAKWKLPADKREDLVKARERLLNALKEPATTKTPEAAAGAQFLYDCWVEQQEENWQSEDIAACREEFFRAIDDLEALQKEEAAKPAEEVVAEPAPTTPAADAPLTLSTSYLVFFEWARSELTRDGKKVVADVIEDLKEQKTYELVLNGHTDTSGPEDFNLELSQKRAEVVKNALLAGGIPPERIMVYAFGESDPRVPTGDEVKEQMNRRVEIFINP